MVEVLHVGPYGKEEGAVKRLREFAKDQGYTLIGGHEEEYIRLEVWECPAQKTRQST